MTTKKGNSPLAPSVLALMVLPVIILLLISMPKEDKVTDGPEVEFVEFKVEDDTHYAIYVSHTSKTHFKVEINSYEYKYEEDVFSEIDSLKKVEYYGSNSYEFYIEKGDKKYIANEFN